VAAAAAAAAAAVVAQLARLVEAQLAEVPLAAQAAVQQV